MIYLELQLLREDTIKMAKFNNPDNSDDGSTPVSNTQVSDSTIQAQLQTTQAISQADASVGLAQAEIDSRIVDHSIQKEEEPWVKAYWRPAAGWMYLLICVFDFIIFPLLAMFLPVIDKGFGLNIGYTPWTSLTLTNGGMIHMSFGAILGISAYTRGMEKLKNAQ